MNIEDIFNVIFTGKATKVAQAIIILLLGILIARFVSKLIKKVLAELRTDKILKEEVGVKVPIEDFLSSVIKYLIYFVAIILALNYLGLAVTVLYIILIIVFVVIIILIILAFKDFMPNLSAGFFIYQKRNFKVGDEIELKGIKGKIININLVEIKIKT